MGDYSGGKANLYNLRCCRHFDYNWRLSTRVLTKSIKSGQYRFGNEGVKAVLRPFARQIFYKIWRKFGSYENSRQYGHPTAGTLRQCALYRSSLLESSILTILFSPIENQPFRLWLVKAYELANGSKFWLSSPPPGAEAGTDEWWMIPIKSAAGLGSRYLLLRNQRHNQVSLAADPVKGNLCPLKRYFKSART